MAIKITAANFDETFPLDYAQSLADGLSNIEPESRSVSLLMDWCASRGEVVSREVCCEVLESQIESLTQNK